MHYYLTAVALSLSLSSFAAALSVGVISDMHVNALYNPTSSSSDCIGDTNSSKIAPLGRYGCDGPPTLSDVMA